MKDTIQSEIVKTSLGYYNKREDGIIELRFNEDEYEIDLPHIDEFEKAYGQLTNQGKDSYFLLVVSGQYGVITKEAREKEVFKDSVYSNLSGMAIVVTTLHKRLLGNMYFSLKINKPSYEHKLFPTEEAAIKWLKNLNSK